LLEDVEAVHDKTFKLDTEEVSDTGSHMDIGQATNDKISSLKKDHRKKIWLYLPIAITLIVALFAIFENFNKLFKNSVSVPIKSAPHKEIDNEHSTNTVVDTQTDKSEYYIQVGAWKNPDYAQEMLMKLNQYYPDAYITVKNNFHKIWIPVTLNNGQGADISKDIEKKFNIKPIIVRK
jgi:hypothetical protein